MDRKEEPVLIKETVDAIRIAESDAEKTVMTAKDNAMNMKNDIKIRAQSYREEETDKVKDKARRDMEETIKSCSEADREYNAEIDRQVIKLKEEAAERQPEAVKAVIDALF